MIEKIINHKEKRGKCNIVPIPVNKILGQILSQFSIMPELNSVYSELFSNKGATFYSKSLTDDDKIKEGFEEYLSNHNAAIPITVMDGDTPELFYIAENESDYDVTYDNKTVAYDADIVDDYQFEPKHIVIIGHNSKTIDILEGFNSFFREWDQSKNLIDIMIIDDAENLKKFDFYRDKEKYWYISNVVQADVYDRDTINRELNEYIDSHTEDTSVLILSDDNVPSEDIDSNALTYLIYVQDIISEHRLNCPDFAEESIDVVVELLNPKNYDVARSYSINNIIISNRYISKMIAQVGEKEAIYDFYKDILTYDIDNGSYSSRELYIKSAERFFTPETVFPIVTTPRALIQGVYKNSPDYNKSIVFGIVKHGEGEQLFVNSKEEQLVINKNDKLILFAAH